MALELDPRADPAVELSSLLVALTREAAGSFEVLPLDEAVHLTRKHCKRTRAVVELARPAIGRERVRALQTLWRDAARELGPLREAHVLAKSLAALEPEADPIEVFGPAAQVEDVEGRVARSRALLARAEAEVVVQDWRGVDRDCVVKGFTRGYQRARDDRTPALESGDTHLFHEWRKTAKAWGYHLITLRRVWPDVLDALYAEADALQEALGAHHDLGMVRHFMRGELPPQVATRLRERALAREDALFEEAREVSRCLLAAEPAVMASLVEAAWATIPSS